MQRYFSNKLENNKFELNKDDLYHILTVMRMKTGDSIEVVYNEEVYICNLEINNNNVDIIIKSKEEKKELETIEKVLIIPLLKENKMDLIFQKSTELGIDKIIPVIMERSIIKLDKDKELKKVVRWNKICKEASEQSKRVNIPIVTEVKTLKELENIDGIKLVCSTKEKDNTIKKYLKKNNGYNKINIVIGPEGGISPKEEEYLNSIGFESVSLGNNIMRVETVPIYILSVINYENM
jgi:16S rRNA (uracil1498-N3)-methyltransferase